MKQMRGSSKAPATPEERGDGNDVSDDHVLDSGEYAHTADVSVVCVGFPPATMIRPWNTKVDDEMWLTAAGIGAALAHVFAAGS